MSTCDNSVNCFGWLDLISDLLNAIFNWVNGYAQNHLLKMSESLFKYGLDFGLGGKKTSSHKISICHIYIYFFEWRQLWCSEKSFKLGLKVE